MGKSWSRLISSIWLLSSPSHVTLSLEVFSVTRRRILASWTGSVVPAVFMKPSGSLAAITEDDTIDLHLERGERIGMELYDTVVAGKHVLVIKSVSANASVKNLKPGMVVANFQDSKSLVKRLQNGPFPVDLRVTDPNAVPDRLLPSNNSLDTKEVVPPSPPSSEEKGSFVIRTVREVTKGVKSRRGDLVEFVYEARVQSPVGSVYDSSAQRGTGQPYQYVIGSGDLIPGVDLGLYDMRPGEVRLLEIPSPLAYGSRGNKLFGIPPNTTLFWTIEMIRVNFIGEGQESTDN